MVGLMDWWMDWWMDPASQLCCWFNPARARGGFAESPAGHWWMDWGDLIICFEGYIVLSLRCCISLADSRRSVASQSCTFYLGKTIDCASRAPPETHLERSETSLCYWFVQVQVDVTIFCVFVIFAIVFVSSYQTLKERTPSACSAKEQSIELTVSRQGGQAGTDRAGRRFSISDIVP